MEASRGYAVALAVAVVLGTPVLAQAAQASEHADEEEPHLLVRVENDGDQAQDVNVTVEGPRDWARDATVSPGKTWEKRIDGPQGVYDVTVTLGGDNPGSFSRLAADTEGCAGPFLFPFTVGGGFVQDGDPGCLGTPTRFIELVDEATRARDAEGGDAIRVPRPTDATQGQFASWGRLASPNWTNASKLPFEWLPNATFPNEWGQEVQGAEVVFDPPTLAMAGAATPLFTSTASTQEVQNRLRYEGDDWRPVAGTGPVFASARVSLVQTSSEVRWEITYTPDVGPTTCLFRSPVQGTQVAPGQDDVPSPCPDLFDDTKLDWWTGPPSQHRGFEAVLTFGLDDPENPTRVAKAVWAEGVAYPLVLELFVLDEDGTHDLHLARNLTHLETAGEPVGASTSPDAVPRFDEGPLNPLQGPALQDRNRVPFPLSQAVEAAQRDPTLSVDLLGEDDVALAGATLGTPGDHDAGSVRELAWTMAFTTNDEGPAFVECRQAHGRVDGRPLSSPVARCEELDEPPAYAPRLDEVAHVGADQLPSRSVSWDVALDRWALLDPDNASAPATVASYRAPGALERLSIPGGRLTVGAAGSDPEPGPVDSDDVPTTVTIGLGDGATRSYRTGVKTVQGLANPGDALSPSAAQPPVQEPGLDPGSRLVAKTAAGAGLLGLLAFGAFALYSRLTREEVLADDTRQQIRQLVGREPGIHAREIGRRVDANERTVEHHLDILVREEVLSTLERGGYKHFFVKGDHTPREMQALASLRRGKAETVYENIRQQPGVGLTELAQRAEISKPYASKLVGQLVDVGLVDKVREGRRSKLYANDL